MSGKTKMVRITLTEDEWKALDAYRNMLSGLSARMATWRLVRERLTELGFLK